MKTKLARIFSLVVCGGALAGSQPLIASQTVDFTKSLSVVPVAQMPATAAGLVGKAAAAERQTVAAEVVSAAVSLTPASAPAIVSAVAREDASVAPIAAVTAASLQHKQLAMIARAAVKAAPAAATKIVAALIKEFPNDYPMIAVAAADGSPLAGRPVLAAVAANVPAAGEKFQRAVSVIGGGEEYSEGSSMTEISMTTKPVLEMSGQFTLGTLTPSISGPTVGNPPYVPVPGNPKTLTTASTSGELPGKRPYASP